MNHLYIDKIINIKTTVKCKTNIITIDVSLCENIFNIKKTSILFRRIHKDNDSFLIQDISGWIYILSEVQFNYISKYCNDNKVINAGDIPLRDENLEIINEINYKKIPKEQKNISDICVSPLLKKQYNSSEGLSPTFEELKLPEQFMNSNILITDNQRISDDKTNNFASLRSILNSLKNTDNLSIYSQYNYFNYNKNTLNIEKKYTFVQAEDIEETFKLDCNKSVGFINSKDGISTVNSSFNYSPSYDIISTLYDFMDDYEGYTAYIEIEKTSSVDYRVSAVYVRFSSYSWARIPCENFINHEVLMNI